MPVNASVEATFSLDAAFKASVSRVAIEAFRDSLCQSPPSDSTDFPRPPQPKGRALEPMTIEDRFTATPGPRFNEVTRLQWSVGGGILAP